MRWMFVLLATLSLSAVAEVYKWTDENGVTHFGSQPPAGHREEVKIKTSAPGDLGAAKLKARQQQAEKAKTAEPSPMVRAHQAASARACTLAKTELQNAERLLTLGQSANAYDFVIERREKAVNHWKQRVGIHCPSSD